MQLKGGVLNSAPSILNAIAYSCGAGLGNDTSTKNCGRFGSGPYELSKGTYYPIRIQYGQLNGPAYMNLYARFSSTVDPSDPEASKPKISSEFPGSFGFFQYATLGTLNPMSDPYQPYPYWRLGSPGSGFNLSSPYAATPGNPANSWSWMGCWNDKNSPRALSGPSTAKGQTIDNCAEYAWRNGYNIIGLQYGNECWYGNSLSNAERYGAYNSGNGCNTACPGDSNQVCGGSYINNIFQLNGPKCLLA